MTRVDADRHTLDRRSVRIRKSSHVLGANGHAGRRAERLHDGAAVDPAALETIADVGQRHELAAVERHDRRNRKTTSDPRRDDARGNGPVRVQHVESADAPDRVQQPVRLAQPAEAAQPVDTPEVMNGCTEKRVRTRLAIVAQGKNVDLVPPRHRLDEREKRRNNTLPTAAINPAGNNQADTQTTRILSFFCEGWLFLDLWCLTVRVTDSWNSSTSSS